MNNDRKTLIRLASSLPKGSDERRTLLAELQKQSKAPNNILEDFIEMARGNGVDEVQPNNEKVWVRNGNVDACPVCGFNTGAEYDFTRKRGGLSKCSNCGSEYRWSFKLIPGRILNVEFGAGRASWSQYPTKGSYLWDEAAYWEKYSKQSALKGTGVRVLEGYRSDGESDFDGQYHNYRDWDEAIKKTNWGFEERPEGEWDEQWTGEWSVQLIADRPSDAEPDWHGNEVIPQDALIFESKVEPSKDQLQAIKRKWKPVRFD
jgi:hypothetical protein